MGDGVAEPEPVSGTYSMSRKLASLRRGGGANVLSRGDRSALVRGGACVAPRRSVALLIGAASAGASPSAELMTSPSAALFCCWRVAFMYSLRPASPARMRPTWSTPFAISAVSRRFPRRRSASSAASCSISAADCVVLKRPLPPIAVAATWSTALRAPSTRRFAQITGRFAAGRLSGE